MLQKSGGLFQLLAELDFGTAFGIKSLYYKTRTANIADAGQFRMARADVINWRNQANSANLSLGVNSSNVLQFNGVDIQTNLLTTNHIFVGSAGGLATDVAMSGDATIVASGALTIANNVVTNAKLATVATATFKGRTTAGTGNSEDLTVTQATALLNNMVGDSGAGGTKGLVPAPAAGDAAANKFLRANGLWVTPPGAGDVVGPASSTDNALVVYDGATGKLVKNSVIIYATGSLSGVVGLAMTGSITAVVNITNSGAIVSTGSITSKNSLILEDPGAGTNTTAIIAGTVGTSYTIALPANVAASNNSVLVSSTAGALTYVVSGSANVVSTIVQRDASGNFIAGTITAALTGTASGNTTYTPNQYGLVTSGAANVMTVIAPNASTVLPLISGGASAVPAWGVLAIAGGGTGQITKAAAFDALSPMSAGGDLIYGGASGTGTRLPNGTAGQVLKSAGTTLAPVWTATAVTASSQIIRGTAASKGGSSSGETTCVNYSAAISSSGTDITFTARTTTTADFYTINTTGIYAIWMSMTSGAGAEVFGISVNSTGTSTAVQSLATSQTPAIAFTGGGNGGNCGCTLKLTAGDIVRAQCETGLVPSGSAVTRFGITRVD